MINDLLRPCETPDCGVGDIICMICGKAYCEDHIDGHDCVDEEYGGEG
jgi:hypothetical protein